MDSVIVGMFDEADEASEVVRDLERRGIPRSRITVEEEPATPTQGADTAGGSRSKGEALQELSFFQRLGDAITGRERATYEEGVRRGHTVVTATVNDGMVDDTIAVMRDHGALDIDERSTEWRSQGWRTQLTDFDDDDGAEVGGPVEDGGTFPVVEEELQVGKREVRGGGVRVFSHVTERPVEEQVQLREERVVVERRPVDRAVDANAPGMFEEGSFEVTERSEEAVVGKEVRVVEEVVVGKQATERTQTVRDTVRRTDVEVEQIPGPASGQGGRGATGIQQYDGEFQDHYRSEFGAQGRPYGEYAPAYQYGGQLAAHDDYRGRSWDEISPQVQRSWEASNPGTWEQMKAAVRYGWERLTGGGSDTPRH